VHIECANILKFSDQPPRNSLGS